MHEEVLTPTPKGVKIDEWVEIAGLAVSGHSLIAPSSRRLCAPWARYIMYKPRYFWVVMSC